MSVYRASRARNYNAEPQSSRARRCARNWASDASFLKHKTISLPRASKNTAETAHGDQLVEAVRTDYLEEVYEA